MNKKFISLESLVGLGTLSGVGNGVIRHSDEHSSEDWLCSWFTLNGTTYTATEDPCDGYRSSLIFDVGMPYDVLKKDTIALNVPVFCVMSEMPEDKVLVIYDTRNAKPILRVGTSWYDSYYPSYVFNWMPENLWENKEK